MAILEPAVPPGPTGPPSIEPGRYRIFNVANPAVCITVVNASAKRGANFTVYNATDVDASSFSNVFDVSYRDDGSARIVNTYSGLALDLTGGTIANTTNIQQWSSNNSNAQRWQFVPAGSTTMHQTPNNGSQTFFNYKIALAADPSYVVDVWGQAAASGANIMLYQDLGESDQLWNFIPMSVWDYSGLYELRSAAAPNVCLDVKTWSKEDGARVHLFDAAGSNNQKWFIKRESTDSNGTKWSLRSINSGKYLDVFDGQARVYDGQDVGQWSWNSGQNQLWSLNRYGSTTVDGVKCDTVSVGSFATTDGNTWMLDSSTGLTTNRTWATIHAKNGRATQLWALLPTVAVDETMPVPQRIGVTNTIGVVGKTSAVADPTKPAYLTWECADAWATVGLNHYEYRYRKRFMDSQRGVWRDWSEVTEWRSANCKISGNRAWMLDSLELENRWFDWSNGKRLELEVQVRTVGVDNSASITGVPATQIIEFWKCPNITYMMVGLGADGLHFEYESEYAYGSNVITVTSIVKDTTAEQLLRKPYTYTGDSSSSFVVPFEYIDFFNINDGEQITFKYTNGTEAHSAGDTKTLTAGVTESAHTFEGFDHSITYDNERSVCNVAFSNIGNPRCFVAYAGGVFEVEGPYSTDGGKAHFSVPVPFEQFKIYISTISPTADDWGVDVIDSSAVKVKPAHAWTWGTKGAFSMLLNISSPVVTDRSISNDTDKYKLAGRKHETVRFGTVVSSEFSAAGVIRTKQQLAWLEELAAQHYALYRPPHGGYYHVAITDVSYTIHRDYVEVKVNMVEVDSLCRLTGATKPVWTALCFTKSTRTTLTASRAPSITSTYPP